MEHILSNKTTTKSNAVGYAIKHACCSLNYVALDDLERRQDLAIYHYAVLRRRKQGGNIICMQDRERGQNDNDDFPLAIGVLPY